MRFALRLPVVAFLVTTFATVTSLMPYAEAQTSDSDSSTSYMAAGRILNQATFGPTADDLSLVRAIGVSNYVKQQLAQPAFQMQDPLVNADYSPGDCGQGWNCAPLYWWWSDVLWGQDQLRERVAFALSKLFVVSLQDVDARYFPYYLNVLNRDAFGNWLTLMKDVSLSPAMGMYLNAANSLYTPGAHADENFGRELMQLFSIGTVALNNDGTQKTDGSGNPIPNYTSAIVQDFGRAFTGFTLAENDCSTPSQPMYMQWAWAWGQPCPMVPLAQYHDSGQKTLLRGTVLPAGQSPTQDWNAALANIFNDPSLPPFVCTRLIQNLVKSNPSPAYVNRIANVFINDGTGTRGNLTAVIYAILMDNEARKDDGGGTPDANTGLLRDPILQFTAVTRGLEATDSMGFPNVSVYAANLAQNLADMNEQPMTEPSVFSFYSPTNALTINGNQLLAPEFENENTLTLFWMMLHMEDLMSNNNLSVTYPGEFSFDLSAGSPLAFYYRTYGLDELIYVLNILFLHDTMSPQMAAAIKAGVSQDHTIHDILHDAVYLIVTSPQFRVMI